MRETRPGQSAEELLAAYDGREDELIIILTKISKSVLSRVSAELKRGHIESCSNALEQSTVLIPDRLDVPRTDRPDTHVA